MAIEVHVDQFTPNPGAPGGPPPATGSLNPPLTGLTVRAVNNTQGLEAHLGGVVCELMWYYLQPTAYGAIDTGNHGAFGDGSYGDLTQILATTNLPIRLRVRGGIYAPNWAKQEGGTPMTWFQANTVTDPVYTIPRWWVGYNDISPTTGYAQSGALKAWDDFITKLMALVGDNPRIREVDANPATTMFSEPMLRQFGGAVTQPANTITAWESWAPATAYKIGDTVKNAGTSYYCTGNHTSPGSFTVTNWTTTNPNAGLKNLEVAKAAGLPGSVNGVPDPVDTFASSYPYKLDPNGHPHIYNLGVTRQRFVSTFNPYTSFDPATNKALTDVGSYQLTAIQKMIDNLGDQAILSNYSIAAPMSVNGSGNPNNYGLMYSAETASGCITMYQTETMVKIGNDWAGYSGDANPSPAQANGLRATLDVFFGIDTTTSNPALVDTLTSPLTRMHCRSIELPRGWDAILSTAEMDAYNSFAATNYGGGNVVQATIYGASAGPTETINQMDTKFGGVHAYRSYNDETYQTWDYTTCDARFAPSTCGTVWYSFKPDPAIDWSTSANQTKLINFFLTFPTNKKFIITCQHEADQAVKGFNPAQVRALHRAAVTALHAANTQRGSTNLTYASVIMSYTVSQGTQEAWYEPTVDMVGIDVYTSPTCIAGVNWAVGKGKPWGIGEYGARQPTDAAKNAQLLADYNTWSAPANKPVAVCWFDSGVGGQGGSFLDPTQFPITTATWRKIVQTGSPV